MGRAYEVRKASIQKTGAAKAKLYSTFAKEITKAAKGNPEIDTNITLKRVVEKAKHQQVPTDNVNRTVSFVREAFNKCHKSLGVTNSVAYNYDYLAIIGFASDNGDDVMMSLLDKGIEIIDLESEEGEVVITAKPSDASSVKDVVEGMIPNVVYTIDEVGWYAKEKCTLEGEDKEVFERLLSLLENIDDVDYVYHNVDLG